MRRRSCCLGFMALLAALAAGYWYGSIALRNGIASAIEANLPTTLGPASNYDVTVWGSPIDLPRGRIREVHILGEQVELRNGLCLDRVHTQMRGVRLNRQMNRLVSIKSASFSASASQKHISDYAASRFSDIPNCRIKLRENGVTISANPDILGVTIPIEADGALRVSDRRKVVLGIARLRSPGTSVTIPRIAKRYIEERLSPLIDASAVGFGLKLDSVKTTPDAVTLEGSLNSHGANEE